MENGTTIHGEKPALTYEAASDAMYEILSQCERNDSLRLLEQALGFVLKIGVKPAYQPQVGAEFILHVFEGLNASHVEERDEPEEDDRFREIKGNA
jgi:hypothetical protein